MWEGNGNKESSGCYRQLQHWDAGKVGLCRVECQWRELGAISTRELYACEQEVARGRLQEKRTEDGGLERRRVPGAAEAENGRDRAAGQGRKERTR